MTKPFAESFAEWREDNSYTIGEDIGWEFSDVPEPTPFPGHQKRHTRKGVRRRNNGPKPKQAN